MIPAAASKADLKKKIPCRLIFNKPLPNLCSSDTYIQGTPSSVLRVSPEL